MGGGRSNHTESSVRNLIMDAKTFDFDAIISVTTWLGSSIQHVVVPSQPLYGQYIVSENRLTIQSPFQTGNRFLNWSCTRAEAGPCRLVSTKSYYFNSNSMISNHPPYVRIVVDNQHEVHFKFRNNHYDSSVLSMPRIIKNKKTIIIVGYVMGIREKCQNIYY